jgi:hypothetical protein
LKKLLLVSACLVSISWINPSSAPAIPNAISAKILPTANRTDKNAIRSEAENLFSEMHLAEKGLSKSAFEYAYIGYRRLLEKGMINEASYLTICDFSQSSNKKRMYLLDLANNTIILNTYVAHGRNSGGEYANRFSNKPSSYQSSLGFYITKDTYYGEHGLSLRIAGVETGYNDKALRRRIVIHGADYIEEKWLRNSNFMGRSYGCPAVPPKERDLIINTIKNGTCFFIYHPSKAYLKGSKILND